jgi:hypothetical protein
MYKNRRLVGTQKQVILNHFQQHVLSFPTRRTYYLQKGFSSSSSGTNPKKNQKEKAGECKAVRDGISFTRDNGLTAASKITGLV